MILSDTKQRKKTESKRGSVILIAILSTVTLFALWNYSADVRQKRKGIDRPPLFI